MTRCWKTAGGVSFGSLIAISRGLKQSESGKHIYRFVGNVNLAASGKSGIGAIFSQEFARRCVFCMRIGTCRALLTSPAILLRRRCLVIWGLMVLLAGHDDFKPPDLNT